MVRGTTPTFTLTVGDNTVNLETASAVYVTVKQRNKTITKTDDALDVDGNVVSCYLTEAESLQLTEGSASIQVNWKVGSKRLASECGTISITKQLLMRAII